MNLILFTVSISMLISGHYCYNSFFNPFGREGYIVGGQNATDGLAPFQCSLQFKGSQHFCGCAILSSKWIITAAHCFRNQNPKNVQILVGTNDLKSGGTKYNIERWTLHEQYNIPYLGNDIAVAKVSGVIEFNEKEQPIKYSSNEVPAGTVAQLTGWGRTSATSAVPQFLQVIKLNVISKAKCKSSYWPFGSFIHVSHLCTLNRAGQGACSGDSGGPLIYNNELIGIVNFGVPCAFGFPDGFAKVPYHYNWIKKNTGPEY